MTQLWQTVESILFWLRENHGLAVLLTLALIWPAVLLRLVARGWLDQAGERKEKDKKISNSRKKL